MNWNIRKSLSLMIMFVLLVVIMLPLSASASVSSNLSVNDVEYLKEHVKLSADDISSLPQEVLRSLIENEAVRVLHETGSFREREQEGIIRPLLDENDMDLTLDAYTVSSDRPGYKKVYLLGQFKWINNPSFTFTDVMTIGIPESVGFFLPVNSSNKVQQHEAQYNWYLNSSGWNSESSTEPSKFYANSGVANKYNLRSQTPIIHSGWISQTMYIKNTEWGTTNVTLEYGHAYLGFTPSVSIYPFGIGVTPVVGVDRYPIIGELHF